MANVKNNLKSIFGYFTGFLGLIVFLEFVLLETTVGLKEAFFGFLFFAPAGAMVLTVLTGFSKSKKINAIWTAFMSLIIWLYYSAQVIYYGNFGSFFSVSLIRMGGEALGNFWWAILSTLAKKAPVVLGTLLPIVAVVILFACKKISCDRISLWGRLACVFITALLVWAGIGQLKSFGTGRASAYEMLYKANADTDSSVEKLGAMTTFVLEMDGALFGRNTKQENEKITINVIPPSKYEEHHMQPKIEKEEEEIILKHENPDIDIDYLRTCTEDETILALLDFFEARPAEEYNEYTGMMEGYNLIYICAESFATYAMDERLTPLLCEMSKNGIVLENYYTTYKNTTTNGEFALSTGLFADVSRFAADGNDVGSFARSSSNYMPYGLGNIFAEEGVPSYAYHGYISSYYKRGDSWPNLGYQNIKFMHEGLEFVNKWSPADTELMEQSVDDYINEDRFFTYYMTYSGHGSYTTDTYMYLKNNEKVRELLGDSSYTDEEIAYYCGSYELELAMEYLVKRLEEAGKLDKTLIVLASDHVPCSLSGEAMQDLSKRQGLAFDWNFELYHSTCIMYNSAVEEPIISDEYCCNVDVLPTVLNLLGLEYDSRFMVGDDILSFGLHRARIYNGNFLEKRFRYNASKGTATWSDEMEEVKEYTEEDKEVYIDNRIMMWEDEYNVSTAIIDKDFYDFIQSNIYK